MDHWGREDNTERVDREISKWRQNEERQKRDAENWASRSTSEARDSTPVSEEQQNIDAAAVMIVLIGVFLLYVFVPDPTAADKSQGQNPGAVASGTVQQPVVRPTGGELYRSAFYRFDVIFTDENNRSELLEDYKALRGRLQEMWVAGQFSPTYAGPVGPLRLPEKLKRAEEVWLANRDAPIEFCDREMLLLRARYQALVENASSDLMFTNSYQKEFNELVELDKQPFAQLFPNSTWNVLLWYKWIYAEVSGERWPEKEYLVK